NATPTIWPLKVTDPVAPAPNGQSKWMKWQSTTPVTTPGIFPLGADDGLVDISTGNPLSVTFCCSSQHCAIGLIRAPGAQDGGGPICVAIPAVPVMAP